MPAPLIPVPKEWPKEVADRYDPVRTLGKGGFASVTLAKEKANPKVFVAMKIVGASSNTFQRAYAHREMDILRSLTHEHIMKVLQSWEPKVGPAVLALSYSRGPTVQALLKHGGALSSPFGRVVFAQLTDAVAYLHSHAVIHRDIKPDNVVVTGALSKDDSIWDNADEIEGPRDSSNSETIQRTPEYWEKMRSKWKVTLVDFGFARALTPQDVSQPSLEILRENLDASYHARKIDIAGPKRKSGVLSNLRQSLSNNNVGLDDSAHSSTDGSRRSLFMRRTMSAVGNKLFAAPEILNDMHLELHDDPVTLTDTISNTVSEYGLMVDAYSLGCTLRYMMTGCLPHIPVKDAIAEQTSFLNVLFSSCSNRKKKRKVRYRLEEDLPPEVQILIVKMTEKAEKKRTSVRHARSRYPWVSDVLPEESMHDQDIEYLSLATMQEEASTDEPEESPVTF